MVSAPTLRIVPETSPLFLYAGRFGLAFAWRVSLYFGCSAAMAHVDNKARHRAIRTVLILFFSLQRLLLALTNATFGAPQSLGHYIRAALTLAETNMKSCSPTHKGARVCRCSLRIDVICLTAGSPAGNLSASCAWS